MVYEIARLFNVFMQFVQLPALIWTVRQNSPLQSPEPGPCSLLQHHLLFLQTLSVSSTSGGVAGCEAPTPNGLLTGRQAGASAEGPACARCPSQ